MSKQLLKQYIKEKAMRVEYDDLTEEEKKEKPIHQVTIKKLKQTTLSFGKK